MFTVHNTNTYLITPLAQNCVTGLEQFNKVLAAGQSRMVVDLQLFNKIFNKLHQCFAVFIYQRKFVIQEYQST